MLFTLCVLEKLIHVYNLHKHVHKMLRCHLQVCSCHDCLLYNALTGGIPCREDAYAALQLYQLYVRDDPALMTYQELVESELRKMKRPAESKPDGT